MEIIRNATLARSAINRENDEVIANGGTVIDDALYAILEDNRAAVREVYILKGEQQAVNIIGEDDLGSYCSESAAINVDDGQVVKAGDKLVSDIEPMVSEISGKVNYIYGYNKIICEEIIEKILVYSGVEFSYPASLSLKFRRP